MKGKAGTVARIGAFAVLALLLSGCIKLTMDLQVNSDDTVSGTIQLGIQKELLELSGGSVQDLLGSDSPFPSDAPGVTVEEFDDGEFAGQEFTFDSVPIAEFQATDDPDALSILRQGDVFVVSGVLDMSGALSGATGGIGTTGQELLDSAEIRITMTFPGDVQEATGTIDGNSVTWAPEFGQRLEISATASAIDDGDAGGGSGGSSMTIILIIVAVAVVVVGAIIAFFVMKGRRGGGSGDGEQAGFETAPAETPSAPPATPAETPSAPPAPPAPPVPPAPPSE